MTPEPLVSVVVPTFNRAEYLEACVASVLAQTWSSWELIVIDDGSTDATTDYLRDVADPRVRTISLPHSGVPARVRNAGLAAATGDLVAFLDSDDLWDARKLEIQVADLLRHPECGWSYTDVELIDDGGRVLPKSRFRAWKPRSGDIVEALLAHEAMVACPTVLAKLRLIEDAGRFDEALRFSEDYDLWLRLAACSRARAVPQRLSRVRLHAGNNTRGRPEVNEAFVQVYTKFLRAQNPPRAIRKLCNRQRAHYAVYHASQLRLSGATARAFGVLAASFRYRPWNPRWWRALARTSLSGLLSASLRRRVTDVPETRLSEGRDSGETQ